MTENPKADNGSDEDSGSETAAPENLDNQAPAADAPADTAEDFSSSDTVSPESGDSGDSVDADQAADVDDQEEQEQQEAEEPRPAPGPGPMTLSRIDLDPDADPRDDTAYEDDEYDEMLAMYDGTLTDIAEGKTVSATVIGKTDTEVLLDVGFKSEGAVSFDEFSDPDEVKEGDKVDVLLENLENERGVVVLSKRKADFLRVWEEIKTAFDEEVPVRGRIKRRIKGGATVDLMGVDAFLPGSQIALRRVSNVDDLVGEEFDFRILKLNKRRRNIVVSRRVLLEEERAGKREELKEIISAGDTREGIVKNITDFGAFVDLGGMDGLLHITDMSWGRVGHPSEICDVGQKLEIKILDIDWDRERISLGLKQLQEYPWKNVAEKYPVGARVAGRVVSITNYGAFIELEEGIEGLVHISEMSWTRTVRHPSQLVEANQEVECVILGVNEEGQKISLGMKQVEEDPWIALPPQYPPGTRIKGVVRNLTSFGAFVEVAAGIDGLVHISDMSWTRRVQHPSEVLRKGETVEVVVLSIDPDQKRISLGLKQVREDPWYDMATEYNPGTELTGTIVRLDEKGVVVDLGGDVEGFVPMTQLGLDASAQRPADRYSAGDELQLRVLETDVINRRMVLGVTESEGSAATEDEPQDQPADQSGDEPAGESEDETEDEPAGEADKSEGESEDEPDGESEDESEEESAAGSDTGTDSTRD